MSHFNAAGRSRLRNDLAGVATYRRVYETHAPFSITVSRDSCALNFGNIASRVSLPMLPIFGGIDLPPFSVPIIM